MFREANHRSDVIDPIGVNTVRVRRILAVPSERKNIAFHVYKVGPSRLSPLEFPVPLLYWSFTLVVRMSAAY